MTELVEFPFDALAREAIAAEWDACHPSICDPNGSSGMTSPDTTLGMWVHLRSDTKEERAKRKEWPEKILQFRNLRCLSVNGCTPELFDSICTLPALRRLSVVRGRISDLHKLKDLPSLTHFYYCGSPRIYDLEGLHGLRSLVGLSLIGNFENVDTLDPIASLSGLESLCLGADDFRENRYKSFAPIKELKKLRHVAVFSTKVDRDGLYPIAELRNLEYLYLALNQLKFWSVPEYQHLYANLPKLKGNMIELAATDAGFWKEHKIG